MKGAIITLGIIGVVVSLAGGSLLVLGQLGNPAPTPDNDQHALFYSALGLLGVSVSAIVAAAVWL